MATRTRKKKRDKPLSVRRPVQRRGEKTVAAIREVARRRLGKEPFHQVSMGDIARDAGVAVGTIYAYYPSKDALLLDLRRDLYSQIAGALSGLFAQGSTAEDLLGGLEKLLTVWIDYAVRHRNIGRAVIAKSCESETFAAEVRRHEERVCALGAAFFRAHGDRLRAVDPEQAAQVLYTLIEAAAIHAIRGTDSAESYRGLVRETVRMVGHYLLPDHPVEDRG
jgi:AcrR family transcriptional regulator